MTKTEKLLQIYPDLAVWPEFEKALIGTTIYEFDKPAAVYDYQVILKILAKDEGCDQEDVEDYFAYNYTNRLGAYCPTGQGQPILVDRGYLDEPSEDNI